MATKKLKSLEVHLMLDGEPIIIDDTATDPQASMALAQFEQYKDIVAMIGGVEGVAPYHAVQYIKVSESEGEYEKADPYYCEEETEGGN